MKVKTALTMILTTLFIIGLVAGFSVANAKGYGKSKSFVDANGDGINDNAPDSDGDGVPNGKDADYTGSKARKGNNAKGFVDANGDGINDNAIDSDGDGIPNGQDPDYVKPQDGTGQQRGNTKKAKRGFVDADGDGINDNAIDSDGDGIPNCQDPDYVPAGQAKKTKTRKGQSVNANDPNNANLAPLADRIRDRLQDGSCDGTGFKKTRNRGK